MKNPAKLFTESIDSYQNILICIKGSPDPDAIASAFAAKALIGKFGKKAKIVATQKLSLAQNKYMVKNLDIPLNFVNSFEELQKWADSYAVVDHASPEILGLSEHLPCSFHIDHHEPVASEISVAWQWRSKDVGSTSTMMAMILAEMNPEIDDSLLERMATALVYGIQTDTDKYTLATKQDYSAINYLSRYSNKKVLSKISGVPLGKTTASHLQIAQRNKSLYKDWLITGIGYISEKNRDDIAIIADFLLKREEVEVAIVFALIENERKRRLVLDASLRSKNPKMNLHSLIKHITIDGGARKFKGAFQVNMDYFSGYTDKEEFWNLLQHLTSEKFMRERDALYKDKIQGFFQGVKGRVKSWFSRF